MSHLEQRKFVGFVKEYFPHFFTNKKVLEIGSLSVNRSVREFFHDCDYTGVDLELGKCVDVAIPGQLVDFASKSFDLTISCECFEHNPFWLETFTNMLRMTKPGGLVVMTCACYGRPEHGTTRSTPGASPLTVRNGWEYYCNLNDRDFLQKINFDNWFSHHQFCYNYKSKDLYFIGTIKNPESEADYIAPIQNVAQEYQNWQNLLYQNMCIFLGRDIFQNLRLYWLLDPKEHITHKWKRTFQS